MKNRIYFFTGTGNSFRIAEKIGEELTECELVAITDKIKPENLDDYECIGFVFPVYFQGLPQIVADFFHKLNAPKQNKAYYFIVATYGGLSGNAIAQAERLLSYKGIRLNYSREIKMFSNYVILYNMSRNIDKITEKSELAAAPIVSDIRNRKENQVSRFRPILHWYYKKRIKHVSKADLNFSVSEACTGCGKCARLCASDNIKIKDGRPEFQHHCNQCVACIQHCPQKAINYKKCTQSRRRYIHPKVGYKKLVQYYR